MRSVGDQVAEAVQVVRVTQHGAVRVDRALGIGGRARAVDHHHRVARAHLALDLFEQRIVDAGRGVGERLERRGAARGPGALAARALPDPDFAEIGQRAQAQRRGAVRGELGRELLQPLQVVVVQEARGGEQRVHVGVAQHEAELARLVEGVERHHQRADARSREPRQHPVRPVRQQQPTRVPLPTPVASSPRASLRERRSASS